MVIVSQDREGIAKRIINFDNTSLLGLDEGDHTSIVFEDIIKIGEYATKKRAKEVLQEMLVAYSNFQLAKNVDRENKDMAIRLINIKYKYFDIYEMPEA